MNLQMDVEYLFVPDDSIARQDRIRQEADFQHVENYLPNRNLDKTLVCRVIIQASREHKLTMFVDDKIREIEELDSHIRLQMSTESGLKFQDVCWRFYGSCMDSGFQYFDKYKDFRRVYPLDHIPFKDVHINQTLYYPVYTGDLFGGVSLVDDNTTVLDAQALQLEYHLQDTAEGREWAKQFSKTLEERKKKSVSIRFVGCYFDHINDELEKNTMYAIYLYWMPLLALTIFSLIGTIDHSTVKTKHLLGEY